MEALYDILRDLNPAIDYETCEDLIDAHRLDSLSILSLVAELEEAFDVTIPTVDIIPDNFNSAAHLWKMITRLQEEDG